MQQALGMKQVEQEIRQLCRRGLDSVTLRRAALKQLRKIVPFAAYCCGTIDPGTLLITSEVSEGIPNHTFALAAENEYLIEDVYKFNQLARTDNRFGILSQGMAGAPAQSPRWRAVMAPVGFAHELRVAFVVDQACWGGVTLLRHADAADFTVAEGRFLARLATPLAEGLRMALLVDGAGVTINGSGPGLIVLSEKRRVQAMNQTAQAWLDELVEPGEAVHPEHLPAPIYEVAMRAQALARGNGAGGVADHLQAHLRIRTRSGQWLTLHGSHMVKPHADLASVRYCNLSSKAWWPKRWQAPCKSRSIPCRITSRRSFVKWASIAAASWWRGCWVNTIFPTLGQDNAMDLPLAACDDRCLRQCPPVRHVRLQRMVRTTKMWNASSSQNCRRHGTIKPAGSSRWQQPKG